MRECVTFQRDRIKFYISASDPQTFIKLRHVAEDWMPKHINHLFQSAFQDAETPYFRTIFSSWKSFKKHKDKFRVTVNKAAGLLEKYPHLNGVSAMDENIVFACEISDGQILAVVPKNNVFNQPKTHGIVEISTSDEQLLNQFGLCHKCRKYGTYKCERCLEARYCSKACQAADWQRHKATCSKRKKS